MPESFSTLLLRVRPDKISLFRFLLEGYDGLAVLSTLDAKQGLVRLLVPESRYAELWQLLSAICSDLSLRRIEDETDNQKSAHILIT